MRRVQITRLTISLWLLFATVCILLSSGCPKLGSDESPSANPSPSNEEEGVQTTDQYEKARQFFEAFPAKGYSSFEEAEQVAGYHIPRASAEYPVAFDQTALQWFPQFERPLSTTEYTYPPLAPTSIQVIVDPSYFSSGGDEILMSGRPTTVGGKSGWTKPTDISFVFNYLCGEIDGYNLWCTAGGPKEIGWEAFEHFVSTLE